MKDVLPKPVPPNLPTERPGPAGGKRDANRREKVKLLCNVSLELFCNRGVETVTIDEVVAKAKIAKGSFYRYFSGKEEMVETIFAPLVAEMATISKNITRDIESIESPQMLSQIFIDLASAFSQVLATNLDVLRLYLQESRAPAIGARRPIIRLAQEIDEFAYQLTRVAREHGLLRSDHALKVGALTSLGAIERLLFAYVRGDSIGSPAQISLDLIHIILDGVRA